MTEDYKKTNIGKGYRDSNRKEYITTEEFDRYRSESEARLAHVLKEIDDISKSQKSFSTRLDRLVYDISLIGSYLRNTLPNRKQPKNRNKKSEKNKYKN